MQYGDNVSGVYATQLCRQDLLRTSEAVRASHLRRAPKISAQVHTLSQCVAEFPTTLHIGCSALDSINNKFVRVKGKSEINQRALMAVHTISASWEDFRLTCSLLDIKAPNKDMSKSQLNTFRAASVTLAKTSMRFAGEQAYSHSSAVVDYNSGLKECAVSFDASWHRRGHYFNQGFAAATDTDFG